MSTTDNIGSLRAGGAGAESSQFADRERLIASAGLAGCGGALGADRFRHRTWPARSTGWWRGAGNAHHIGPHPRRYWKIESLSQLVAEWPRPWRPDTITRGFSQPAGTTKPDFFLLATASLRRSPPRSCRASSPRGGEEEAAQDEHIHESRFHFGV